MALDCCVELTVPLGGEMFAHVHRTSSQTRYGIRFPYHCNACS